LNTGKRFVAGLATVLVALALALGIYVGGESRGRHNPEPLLPSEAINRLFATRLNNTDGQTQAISQWRGKTLVINFWATWCPPCRQEMPAFSRLQTKYAANGVQFAGISLDSVENVVHFAKENQVTYPLLIADSDGSELARQLGNSQLALPYTVVFSADGDVLLTRLGRVSEEELDRLLSKVTISK